MNLTNHEDTQHDETENTMAVLSSLGGGELEPEGQPLGLDTEASESKLSGSTLAVGVVVLVGVAALFAMKMTLKADAADSATTEAIQEIDKFMTDLVAAEVTGNQSPIQRVDGASETIINELSADPTEHQVPVEEVEKNPFEMMGLAAPPPVEDPVVTGPTPEEQLENYKVIARTFNVDSISGSDERAVVFIDGAMYRIGDTIADSGFTVVAVDGLDVVIQVPADAPEAWKLRLRYE